MIEGDNRPISEQYRTVGMQWADADAAAELLENSKTAVLAERMQAYSHLPVNRAEATVKASTEWHEYIEKMVDARKTANRLKIQMEFLKMRYYEHNSHEATARAELRMTA